MTVTAVLSPLASAAGTDQRRRTLTVFSAADVFDGTRPTGPDMGEAVDFTLGAAASAGVLVGTGDPAFDARLAAATGTHHILVGSTRDDDVPVQATAAGLAAAGRPVDGVWFLEGGHDGTSLPLDAGEGSLPVLSDDDVRATRPRTPVTGPEVFQRDLLGKARAADAHIVLPEGDDDRILRAADELLRDGVCRLTVLGDPAAVRARADELGLDLSGATVTDPTDGEDLERFAADFAELRKHKGVTLDDARETMRDISYYATMMVHTGLADGMVSGAAHTTAHTIRPGLQIIRTAPGASVVSSIFVMVMDGVLWAFGDCAVNPDPTPEQLAEIAAVSAETAAQFGVEPRVAMLSYSTGTSGSGADVEAVAAAVEAARAAHPDLTVDGPLQFDAAVVESVGAKKMPGSDVAGRATVFIFPDLDAGNIAYKAVQRTAGALAVGPILQGLNKPVNDLSRGATVRDIVNTVAVTAVQAGARRTPSGE